MPKTVTFARSGAAALALVVASATLTQALGPTPSDSPERRAVQTTPPAFAIATNGQILDLIRRDGTVYVRGSFTRIGAFTGSGMPIVPATGARVEAPALDGQVSVAVSDQVGGWYVGGNFERIDGSRYRGLAHIAADGTADPGFAPKVGGLVSALALDNGTLYVGGLFDEVNGTQRRNLAAVSATTGALTPFVNSRGTRVTEIVAADSRIYVGSATLVALDPTTGAPSPGFAAPIEGPIRALAADGDLLYVGGRGLTALDTDTGAIDPSFAATPGQFGTLAGVVHTLLPVGGRLYAGGDFTTLGGRPGPLVSLNPTTGVADATFAPRIAGLRPGQDRGVFDLALAGVDLWVGGRFTQAGGSTAENLAAVSPITGARSLKNLDSLDGQVNALETSASGGLYVGGQFFMAGSVRAHGSAALDGQTLLPIASFQGRRGSYATSMINGKRAIFLSETNFTGYQGYTEPGDPYYYSDTSQIRAFNPTTGAWINKLNLTKIKNLTGVAPIGDRLYVAQRLQNDVRFPRNRITAYSQVTGKRVDSFVLRLRGYITEMSSAGHDLVIAGSFKRTRRNGQRANLAMLRVRPANGAVRSSFDPQTHGPIYDISRQGKDLYVTGTFAKAGYLKSKRPGVAKFTLPSGYPGLDLRKAFRAPKHRVSADLTITPLGQIVMLDAFPNLFLDAGSGAKVSDPLDGYGRQAYLAAREPNGIVYVAEMTLPLGANDYYRLSFVSRAMK